MSPNEYTSADALTAQRRDAKATAAKQTDVASNLPRSFASVLMHGNTEDELDKASFWLRDADYMPGTPHFAVQLVRAVIRGHKDTAEMMAGQWAQRAAEQCTEDCAARALRDLMT